VDAITEETLPVVLSRRQNRVYTVLRIPTASSSCRKVIFHPPVVRPDCRAERRLIVLTDKLPDPCQRLAARSRLSRGKSPSWLGAINRPIAAGHLGTNAAARSKHIADHHATTRHVPHKQSSASTSIVPLE
jgi:hypothetical protein